MYAPAFQRESSSIPNRNSFEYLIKISDMQETDSNEFLPNIEITEIRRSRRQNAWESGDLLCELSSPLPRFFSLSVGYITDKKFK